MNTSSSEHPCVSAIIPCFNYGHFVAEAIESVRQQTFSAWEVIVVDDGSTDDTEQVVRSLAELDQRIKYFKQSNQGLAAARNKGIELSRGNYFQFLDADDLLEPQKFEQQVAFLEHHPEVDIVFADARYFRTGHSDERRFSQYDDDLPWVAKVSGTGDVVLMRLVDNNIMVVNAPLLRKSVIEDVGPFEPSVRGIEDWDYWVRCACLGKQFRFEDMEGTRALVRFHATSMSTDARLMLRSALLLHQRVGEKPLSSAVKDLNRRRMSERQGWLGIEEILAGNPMPGLKQIFRAAFTAPLMRHKAKWLICAASAPFVSGDRLKGMVTSSLSASKKRIDASQA